MMQASCAILLPPEGRGLSRCLVKFKYKKVYSANGIPNIGQDKELEIASICGELAAMNGLGAYGSYEPFYGDITIDNNNKSLVGQSWVKIDGKIKKSISIAIDYLMDADSEDFDELRGAMDCGNAEKAHMGAFSEYEVGYGAVISHFMDGYLSKTTLDEKGKMFFSKCLNNVEDPSSCIGQHTCLYKEDKEIKEDKACKDIVELCTIADVGRPYEDKLKEKAGTGEIAPEGG